VAAGQWKPHNQELRYFQSSLNIIFAIKPRKMGCARNMERIAEKEEFVQTVSGGNLKEMFLKNRIGFQTDSGHNSCVSEQ
jgi:hypothetical protein